MQIEIKINGELADLQEVLKALLITQTASEATTAAPAKPAAAKKAKEARNPGDHIKVGTEEYTDGEKYLTGSATYPTPEPQAEPQPEVSNPSTDTAISFETFRKAIGDAAVINKEAVKAILKKYDATKTSEVIPELYAECLADIKAIK